MDLSLVDNLDSLHDPQDWLASAQNLAAELYSADSSFFLVNGSTVGIHAMILSVAGPGDKIIVPRDAHRSVAGAMVLSGCIPVFVMPEVDEELQITLGVTVEAIENAICRHMDAKAVFINNPTYHGLATDLRRVVACAHAHDIPVIVDEAHGPHLAFCDRLPVAAMNAQADLCVQSTHKLLGSLTQCSMLHSRGKRIDLSRLQSTLRILQTTSPSYLLLASLDIARFQMATRGSELIGRTVDLANRTRAEINDIPSLHCFGEERIGEPSIFAMDHTKLTVSAKALGLSGGDLETLLRTRYGVQAELSGAHYTLFLLTLGDTEQDTKHLTRALKSIARDLSFKAHPNCGSGKRMLPMDGEQTLSPREAAFSKRRRISILSALGEISAEVVTIYPPGIPLLWPGERINGSIIEFCQSALRDGARLVGVSGGESESLDVVG